MTVKILTQAQKTLISQLYLSKQWNQKQLARMYLVSERTINRVLNEAGVATAVPRLKGEAYRALKTLEKHNILVDDLDARLSQPTLSKHSVLEYLINCSPKELVEIVDQVIEANARQATQTAPIPTTAQMVLERV